MKEEYKYCQKKYVRVGDYIRVWVESMNRWSDELIVTKLTPLRIVVQLKNEKERIYYRKEFENSKQFIFSRCRPLEYEIDINNKIGE
jgi:hypothetical protein